MNVFEILGYAASIVVAVSMVMNSIVRLRWINLTGAFIFSLYGVLIGALPVALLNGFIVLIDIYYLRQIYSKQEYFTVLEIPSDNKYLAKFMEFYSAEINNFFPAFSFNPAKNTICFFILRDMAVAGVFLAQQTDNKTLTIVIDFAIPAYRDFKLGKYIYQKNPQYFTQKGYEKLISAQQDKIHDKYLIKMGFKENIIDGKKYFVKEL